MEAAISEFRYLQPYRSSIIEQSQERVTDHIADDSKSLHWDR